jgi:hypothetical protein
LGDASAGGIAQTGEANAQGFSGGVAPDEAAAGFHSSSGAERKAKMDFFVEGRRVSHLNGGAIFAEVEQKAAVAGAFRANFDVFERLELLPRMAAFDGHEAFLPAKGIVTAELWQGDLIIRGRAGEASLGLASESHWTMRNEH